MKFRAKVIVKLKNTVKDAKGEAVNVVLKRIGLEEEANVRIGKFFGFEISAQNKIEADKKLENICTEVLVNPVVETYEVLSFEEAV